MSTKVFYLYKEREMMMEKEMVGYCAVCHKPIYCHGGFLEGNIGDDKVLRCLACTNEDEVVSNQ
ncbi:hypothetical protein [Virgibacillus sp. Bac332]|uniref:hypothetical protein n=1 Tax=Virgibacillus sp. Bac332 TaxID=2419842 RepID=UPI0013CF319A|nr:hypothetical protein [Virgibacillus sp. Bac332]